MDSVDSEFDPDFFDEFDSDVGGTDHFTTPPQPRYAQQSFRQNLQSSSSLTSTGRPSFHLPSANPSDISHASSKPRYGSTCARLSLNPGISSRPSSLSRMQPIQLQTPQRSKSERDFSRHGPPYTFGSSGFTARGSRPVPSRNRLGLVTKKRSLRAKSIALVVPTGTSISGDKRTIGDIGCKHLHSSSFSSPGCL